MVNKTFDDFKREFRQEKEVLDQSLRRLQKLKIQQARQGPSTPPDVEMDIEDIQAKIEEFKKKWYKPNPPVSQGSHVRFDKDKKELVWDHEIPAPDYLLKSLMARMFTVLESKHRISNKNDPFWEEYDAGKKL